MELHRTLNPDWRFADTTNYLLGEIATIESERRYFELARVMEDVPEQYWPARYGPAREYSSDQATENEADQAREVAAGIRAETGI